MAKPELGTKRLCNSCGVKFYDLNKDPIVCPKCATVMQVAAVARARPDTAAMRSPATAPEEEAVVPETTDAEFVHLKSAGTAFQPRAPPAS